MSRYAISITNHMNFDKADICKGDCFEIAMAYETRNGIYYAFEEFGMHNAFHESYFQTISHAEFQEIQSALEIFNSP